MKDTINTTRSLSALNKEQLAQVSGGIDVISVPVPIEVIEVPKDPIYGTFENEGKDIS